MLTIKGERVNCQILESVLIIINAYYLNVKKAGELIFNIFLYNIHNFHFQTSVKLIYYVT